ncbi:MAG: Phosphate acetyltransferase [Planctomycetaceae bacterium]|nr:Phosphate acetyltransferase [Planctomycetaceae bacterium]
MSTNLVRTSKFLSLVLRHQPEVIGLNLDEQGWADVEELIRLANKDGRQLTRELLEQVVTENDKQRFAFSDDGCQIRASQGHSVEVDLDLAPLEPPVILYHGTASRFLDSIRATGLHSASRQHVHLSLDEVTATKVGARHGRPVILNVLAREMFSAGHQFFLSANGVWLTESVPVKFIEFPIVKPDCTECPSYDSVRESECISMYLEPWASALRLMGVFSCITQIARARHYLLHPSAGNRAPHSDTLTARDPTP